MAGTWTSQSKILPGAYINFRTNAPLSITPGDRGIVLLLQEMSTGAAGDIYTITVREGNYPEEVVEEDKQLANEALKGAKTVLVYNLGTEHTESTVDNALAKVMTVDFNTLVYPYDGVTYLQNKDKIKAFIEIMRNEEGRSIQAVLANYKADNEAIINVTQGIKLSNGVSLAPAECTAWVGGVTAGASISQSNTNKVYPGAIDVVPRMTKTEMEEAVLAGEFIFKVDTTQNVTALYDINSLTSVTVEKGAQFKKNRVIRVLDGINNDIVQIFDSNYKGKINNNAEGRSLLRATLIEYFNELQRLQAIQNFVTEDVIILPGNDKDSVVIECLIQPVDSIEKMYITVNLS